MFHFCALFRAVFENLVEKQFPAPPRRFVGGTARDTEKSPGRKRSRSSSVDSTDSNRRSLRERAKVRRVVYSDSETEEEKEKEKPADSSDDEGSKKGKFLRSVCSVSLKQKIVNFFFKFSSRSQEKEIKPIRY